MKNLITISLLLIASFSYASKRDTTTLYAKSYVEYNKETNMNVEMPIKFYTRIDASVNEDTSSIYICIKDVNKHLTDGTFHIDYFDKYDDFNVYFGLTKHGQKFKIALSNEGKELRATYFYNYVDSIVGSTHAIEFQTFDKLL